MEGVPEERAPGATPRRRGLGKAGSGLPASCRPRTWRGGAPAPADLAGRRPRRPWRGRSRRTRGARASRAAMRPCPGRRIPRIPSPRPVPAVQAGRRFRPQPSKSRSPPPSFPFLSPPPHPGGREMGGRGWGVGGGRKPLPTAPSERLHRTAQWRRGRAGPGEQRAALFWAVVSWPFDLSAAGETLPLTCG